MLFPCETYVVSPGVLGGVPPSIDDGHFVPSLGDLSHPISEEASIKGRLLLGQLEGQALSPLLGNQGDGLAGARDLPRQMYQLR